MSFSSATEENEIGFYGLSLSAKDGLYKLNIPDNRTLTITSASLSIQSLNDSKSQNTSIIAVCPNGDNNKKSLEYVICTLNNQHTPSRAIELLFVAEQEIELKIHGNGIIHLVGYTTIMSDNSNEDEYDDENMNMVSLPNGLNGQYFDDDSDDDSEDEDDDMSDSEELVDTSNGKIEVVGENEDSDDEDDVSESDSEPAPAPVQPPSNKKSATAQEQNKRKSVGSTIQSNNENNKKSKLNTSTSISTSKLVTPAPAAKPVSKSTPAATSKAAPSVAATPVQSKSSAAATTTSTSTSSTSASASKPTTANKSLKCSQCDKLLVNETASNTIEIMY